MIKILCIWAYSFILNVKKTLVGLAALLMCVIICIKHRTIKQQHNNKNSFYFFLYATKKFLFLSGWILSLLFFQCFTQKFYEYIYIYIYIYVYTYTYVCVRVMLLHFLCTQTSNIIFPCCKYFCFVSLFFFSFLLLLLVYVFLLFFVVL